MNDQQDILNNEAVVDAQFKLNWGATGILVYSLLSGLLIYFLPFGAFSQFSILIHSAVGLIASAPMFWLLYRHWKRRRYSIEPRAKPAAFLSVAVAMLCVVTGLYAVWNGLVGGRALSIIATVHLVSGLLLGIFLLWHLYPIFARYRDREATIRRPVRDRYLAIDVSIIVALLAVTMVLSAFSANRTLAYKALPEDYQLPFGEERPFWPSRATIDGAPAGAALDLGAYPDSESCGSSGCHQEIYEEWRPSAHGFAAEDRLFLRVQSLLAETKGAADTRACAGCHDPLALLAGTRDGGPFDEQMPVTHEGVSCVFCHSVTMTTTEGNGSYSVTTPSPYLFEDSGVVLADTLNRFLIRRYPERHQQDYARPLYKESEFCAACHKQTPLPGTETDVGFAQEQNEYDSWKEGRWFHEGNPSATIECRECHMPLVPSKDPASGDTTDAYRRAVDDQHRSHRVLASNMYIPSLQALPGGEKQSELTIAWLRGEIDIPEIENKWVKGPVVDMKISAPEHIRPGELVNIALYLHNNKTGHDFPAGPLDLLESWVELKVEDDRGETLLLLGSEDAENPAIDAPVVYKADWYDRRGLPVETHNLWDVAGASYKHAISSGSIDIVDVPFQCPGIARPRISGSHSEAGPGERKTDVVFSIANDDVRQLRVSARLLYRKANPEFLHRVFSIEEVVVAPVIELTRAEHIIKIAPGR